MVSTDGFQRWSDTKNSKELLNVDFLPKKKKGKRKFRSNVLIKSLDLSPHELYHSYFCAEYFPCQSAMFESPGRCSWEFAESF